MYKESANIFTLD